jgi:hypothetical protein
VGPATTRYYVKSITCFPPISRNLPIRRELGPKRTGGDTIPCVTSLRSVGPVIPNFLKTIDVESNCLPCNIMLSFNMISPVILIGCI